MAMTTLDRNGHAEPLTRALDSRLARLEQRIKNVAEASEQRASVLRDATADYLAVELAQRDETITKLQQQVADLTSKLEQKSTVDQLVNACR